MEHALVAFSGAALHRRADLLQEGRALLGRAGVRPGADCFLGDFERLAAAACA